MVKKSLLITGLLLSSGLGLNAQTKMVFHKSHSGTSWNFNPKGPGNLGEIGPFSILRSIAKMNDSTYILVYDYSDGTVSIDTLINDLYWTNMDSSNYLQKAGGLKQVTFSDLTDKPEEQLKKNGRKQSQSEKRTKRKN